MTNSYQLDLVATAGHLKALLLAKTASRTRAQAACELISCLTCTSHLTADTVKKTRASLHNLTSSPHLMCLVRELSHSQVLCADAVCTVQQLAGHSTDWQASKRLYLPEYAPLLQQTRSRIGRSMVHVKCCTQCCIYSKTATVSAARMLVCKTACLQSDVVTYRHFAY